MANPPRPFRIVFPGKPPPSNLVVVAGCLCYFSCFLLLLLQLSVVSVVVTGRCWFRRAAHARFSVIRKVIFVRPAPETSNGHPNTCISRSPISTTLAGSFPLSTCMLIFEACRFAKARCWPAHAWPQMIARHNDSVPDRPCPYTL